MEIGTIPFDFDLSDIPRPDLPSPCIVYVCTFSEDEPVGIVLEAARSLPHVGFFVTGNLDYVPSNLIASAPENVRLTGFLPDSEYVALLAGADAVMCLTSRDNTLQRGVYEAMSLAQPAITSDWPALRNAFRKGVVFVENSPDAILAGIQTTLARRDELQAEMAQLRQERRSSWNLERKELSSIVNSLSGKPLGSL